MITVTSAGRIVLAGLVAASLAAIAAVPAAAAGPSLTTAGYAADSTGHAAGTQRDYQKVVAVAVLEGLFERGDTTVVDRFVRPDYIQHNPLVPDGPDAAKSFASGLHQQFPNTKYNVERVISEGNLVLVHSHVVLTPGTRGGAVIDIFRFQNGKLAEHWDTIQEVPATTASGHDMFSTLSVPPTQAVGPQWLTASSKRLVTAYYDQVLVQKNFSATDTFVAATYYQHNPNIPDGAAAAKAGLSAISAQFPQLTVTPVRVIAEGDLVAVHSRLILVPGTLGQSLVDIFRVRHGKIVEHWDVTQDVPETSANGHPMF